MTDFFIHSKNLQQLPNTKSSILSISQTNHESITNIEDQQQEFSVEQQNFHYLHLMIQAGHYSGVIPFKLKSQRKLEGTYHVPTYKLLQPSLIGKTTFTTLWLLSLLKSSRNIREALERGGKHPTIFYVGLINNVMYSMVPFVVYKHIHMSFKKINEMLEAVARCPLLFRERIQLWKLIVVLGIQFLWILSALPPQIFGTTSWNPKLILQALVQDARSMFFLNHKNEHNNSTTANDPENDYISVMNAFLGLTNLLAKLNFELQYQIASAIFATCSLTLWIATRNFEIIAAQNTTILQQPNEGKEKCAQVKVSFIEQLQDNVDELINLSNALNSAWRIVSFWLVLEIAIWFSKDLDIIMKTNDFYMKVYLIILVGNINTAMVLSAECSRKMQCFKSYLVDPKNILEVKNARGITVQGLLQQIKENTFSIGQQDFFVIDYSFISQVLITVVTLFIISLQYA